MLCRGLCGAEQAQDRTHQTAEHHGDRRSSQTSHDVPSLGRPVRAGRSSAGTGGPGGHAGAGSDLAELKSSVASFLQPFPDLTAQVRHLVQEGDLVSVWITYTATHQADFAGVPASGRRVKFAAWDLTRVRDGKIVEITQYCDLFAIMSQIGALPTAAPA